MPGASSVDAMIVAPLRCLVQTGTIGGARLHACYHRISPVIVQLSRWALIDDKVPRDICYFASIASVT